MPKLENSSICFAQNYILEYVQTTDSAHSRIDSQKYPVSCCGRELMLNSQ